MILAAAMVATLAGHAVAAETSDSTVVQGLQGSLAHEVRGVMVPLSEGCLKPHTPSDPDVPSAKL
ncbi:MAG TPA: hypothetical protein VHX64_18835, partial [Caulobacteraceae bacterium]|nr:hypothetical protein [Caulobacteraceae bacterium]